MNEIQIPKGWKIKKFLDITKIYSGGTPKTSVREYWENGTIPWLRSGDLKDNILNKANTFITKKGLDESSAKLWPNNSVLIAITGATTGETGFLTFESTGNQSIVGLLPCSEVLPKFLWYYLQFSYKYFWSKTVGGAQPHINGKIVSQREIVYPNLEIQKKIVHKLDNVLTQIESKKKKLLELSNIKETQKMIPKNMNHLLKISMEGKLTREWRNANNADLEPASVLIQEILKNRQLKWEEVQLNKFKTINKIPEDSKWKDKYEEPIVPDSNPFELPESWTWITLNQIAWSVKDGPHYSPEYSSEGIPFITGGNVRPSRIDFDGAKRISPELHKELSKRCKPEKNDILYTKGGTTGIACVNTSDKEFNVWVHVAVLKLVSPINPFYVQHALNSPFCYSQSQRFTHGVGNQDLGLTRMIRILLPLPPLEEQLEITKILTRKFSELESLKNKINDVLTKKQSINNYLNKITSSVLNEAFSGRMLN